LYKIKELYRTIQGEGRQTGTPAIFVRFTGCNLWSGREADRESAVCRFCDTDFRGLDGPLGGAYTAVELAKVANDVWGQHRSRQKPLVVFTGGEPMLQVDAALIETFHDHGFQLAIETNGTLPVPVNMDWICVSPKAGTLLVQTSGNELKLVFPQSGMDPDTFISLDFDHFYLQPMDGPTLQENIQYTIDYCLKHPDWHLSLQSHKFIGLP
jgi:7-carboxy-7-deazaguanine synthase (Cx14CxxC type)